MWRVQCQEIREQVAPVSKVPVPLWGAVELTLYSSAAVSCLAAVSMIKRSGGNTALLLFDPGSSTNNRLHLDIAGPPTARYSEAKKTPENRSWLMCHTSLLSKEWFTKVEPLTRLHTWVILQRGALYNTLIRHRVKSCCLKNAAHFKESFSVTLCRKSKSLQWKEDTFTKSTLGSAGALLFLTGLLFFPVNFSSHLRLYLSAQALWPSSAWCCTAPAQHLPAPLKSLSLATAAVRPWTWGRYASVRLVSLVPSLFLTGSYCQYSWGGVV